jgi:PHS family inorganic phosphate transporter-like MFS transporter
MGIGIGGEYPLAATIAKEKSSSNRKTVLVFSGQGVGILFAAIMFVSMVQFVPVGVLWRVLVIAGAGPGVATLYFRIKMKETTEFQQLARKETPRITIDDFREGAWKTLLGTASTWFLFDITFYGNGVFAATILKSLIKGDLGSQLYQTSLFNLVIAVISLMGYFCAAYTIDSKRVRKRMQQIIGFLVVAVVFGGLGALLPLIKGDLWVFAPLYGYDVCCACISIKLTSI